MEKDQQLLIYGIGALIGLIVLAMIVILVIVFVRRGKASRAAALAASVVQPPQADTYKPIVTTESPAEMPVPIAEPVKEATPEPVPEKEPEPAPVQETTASTPVALVAPEEKQPEKPEAEVPQKKYDFGAYKEELAHQNPDDKMKEIRDRLEEIKRQRHADPAPVPPKTEAKPIAHEIAPATELEHDPIISEEEILAEEEMDETRPINEVPDPEAVSITEVPQVERLEPQPEPAAGPEAGVEEEIIVPQGPSVAETPTEPGEEDEIPAPEPSVAETLTVEDEEKEPLISEEQPVAETSAAPVEEEPEVERDEIRSEGKVYYTVPNEPVMELQRDPLPEPVEEPKAAKTENTAPHFPNGKFLPMKKLTFAEWVELFK